MLLGKKCEKTMNKKVMPYLIIIVAAVSFFGLQIPQHHDTTLKSNQKLREREVKHGSADYCETTLGLITTYNSAWSEHHCTITVWEVPL